MNHLNYTLLPYNGEIEMKHITIYENDEDQITMKLHHKAPDLHRALCDIKQSVRSYWKHGHSFKDSNHAIRVIYEDIICENIGDLLDV